MRTFYDAVTPQNIPSNPQGVMGYINGPYAWTQAEWNLFPNAVKVTIATHPDNKTSHMIDYEKGDFDDSNVVQAVIDRRNNGGDPIVYCSTSIWDHVKSLFTAAGIAQPQYLIAAYPGVGAVIPAGAIGHQYMDYQNKYDISVVADYIPGVDMTTPVSWDDKFNDPTIDDNGNYTGDDGTQSAVRDFIRFGDAYAKKAFLAAQAAATSSADVDAKIATLIGMVTQLGDAIAALATKVGETPTLPQPFQVQMVTPPTT